MGVIVLEAAFALLLAVAGYAATVLRLNGARFGRESLAMMKPAGRNRLLYIAAALVTGAVLVAVFRSVYAQDEVIGQLRRLTLIFLLLPVAAVDLKTQKIPNSFLLGALILWVAFALAEVIAVPSEAKSFLGDSFIGGAAVGAFFLVMLLVSRNGIGMGDVKLFAVMGLYQGIWGAISSVFCSMLVSFLLAIVLLIARKKGKKDAMPFAPCIFVGTLASVILTGM